MKNSFRSAELSFATVTSRERQGRYELATTVRERVHFQAGNLLAPDCVVGAHPYDFVFCRNVLIYFDGPTQQQVISKLGKLLAPEGILFVGPGGSVFGAPPNRFVSTPHPRAFASESDDRLGAADLLCERNRRAERSSQSASGTKPPSKAAAKPSRNIQHSAREPVEKPTVNLEFVQRLADAGRLADAVIACEAHLHEHGASAGAYYLLGLVRDAMGNDQQAAACYRKLSISIRITPKR